MLSVPKREGSGMVFDSRNFPGTEGVFPVFRYGRIGCRINGKNGGSCSPS